MSAVERVARAYEGERDLWTVVQEGEAIVARRFESTYSEAPIEVVTFDSWASAVTMVRCRCARAAIAALRVPDEAMIAAAEPVYEKHYATSVRGFIKDLQAAMVDAALAE